MKAVARIIAVFVALLFIGGALFLVAVNFDTIPGLAGMFELPAWAGENVVLAVGSGLLLIALILLILGLRPAKEPRNAVLKDSEYGEVSISITAVENMVLRVVQQIQGIKDVSRKVSVSPDGLIVKITISVMPDVSLPGVIDDLQAKTKEYLEEITGISVQEVKVLVANVNMDQPASKK